MNNFTVHGRDRNCLYQYFEPDHRQLVKQGFFIRFGVEKEKAHKIAEDLDFLGISRSTLFPDLEGIARDLSDKHRNAYSEDVSAESLQQE